MSQKTDYTQTNKTGFQHNHMQLQIYMVAGYFVN
jgi:hypothetical protein